MQTVNLNSKLNTMNTKNFEEAAKNTIVAFHIGRGGHYWNPGHLTFIGENRIGKYIDDLFLNYENEADIWKAIEGRPNLEKKYMQAVEGDKEALAFFAERLKMPFGEKAYFDGGGKPVDLTEAEAATGIGKINIDNDYDTTYTRLLSDCNERELKAISISPEWHYLNVNAQDYVKRMLNEEDNEG